MPTRKTTRASHTSTTPPRREATDDISYETKLVIVVLLLLFVYPLGLIFMWFWMRNWPLWLKILISVPLAFAILAIIFGMFAFALFIRHVATSGTFQNDWRYQYQYDHPNMRYRMMPNTTNTPQVTITPTPTDNSGTY